MRIPLLTTNFFQNLRCIQDRHFIVKNNHAGKVVIRNTREVSKYLASILDGMDLHMVIQLIEDLR